MKKLFYCLSLTVGTLISASAYAQPVINLNYQLQPVGTPLSNGAKFVENFQNFNDYANAARTELERQIQEAHNQLEQPISNQALSDFFTHHWTFPAEANHRNSTDYNPCRIEQYWETPTGNLVFLVFGGEYKTDHEENNYSVFGFPVSLPDQSVTVDAIPAYTGDSSTVTMRLKYKSASGQSSFEMFYDAANDQILFYDIVAPSIHFFCGDDRYHWHNRTDSGIIGGIGLMF